MANPILRMRTKTTNYLDPGVINWKHNQLWDTKYALTNCSSWDSKKPDSIRSWTSVTTRWYRKYLYKNSIMQSASLWLPTDSRVATRLLDKVWIAGNDFNNSRDYSILLDESRLFRFPNWLGLLGHACSTPPSSSKIEPYSLHPSSSGESQYSQYCSGTTGLIDCSWFIILAQCRLSSRPRNWLACPCFSLNLLAPFSPI